MKIRMYCKKHGKNLLGEPRWQPYIYPPITPAEVENNQEAADWWEPDISYMGCPDNTIDDVIENAPRSLTTEEYDKLADEADCRRYYTAVVLEEPE